MIVANNTAWLWLGFSHLGLRSLVVAAGAAANEKHVARISGQEQHLSNGPIGRRFARAPTMHHVYTVYTYTFICTPFLSPLSIYLPKP